MGRGFVPIWMKTTSIARCTLNKVDLVSFWKYFSIQFWLHDIHAVFNVYLKKSEQKDKFSSTARVLSNTFNIKRTLFLHLIFMPFHAIKKLCWLSFNISTLSCIGMLRKGDQYINTAILDQISVLPIRREMLFGGIKICLVN